MPRRIPANQSGRIESSIRAERREASTLVPIKSLVLTEFWHEISSMVPDTGAIRQTGARDGAKSLQLRKFRRVCHVNRSNRHHSHKPTSDAHHELMRIVGIFLLRCTASFERNLVL